jgi:hypothetical protein
LDHSRIPSSASAEAAVHARRLRSKVLISTFNNHIKLNHNKPLETIVITLFYLLNSPLASAKDPEVTGFSRPSAVVSTADEHPAGTTFYGGRDVEPFEEVCDNFVNPLVLDDSEVFVKDRLFNLLVIVICSIVLVGIVLTVAVIIWRYESASRFS